jgi:uncharacterized membrane protein YraQ (UPF0718 family)
MFGCRNTPRTEDWHTHRLITGKTSDPRAVTPRADRAHSVSARTARSDHLAMRLALSTDRVLFVTLLLTVAVIFPPVGERAEWQDSFATYVHAIILEAFPYLLLGTLLAGLIEWLLPSDFLPRLTARLGIFSMPAILVLAPLTPVCECGVVPIARGLLAKGLPLPHTVAYLLAAPILNPTVMLTTWLAFQDWCYPVYRVIGAVLVALAVGAVVARLGAPRVVLEALLPTPQPVRLRGIVSTGSVATVRKKFATSGAVNGVLAHVTQAREHASWRQRLGRLATNVLAHFLDLAGYFLVGVFIAAGMKTFLGTHFDAVGPHPFFGPIAMMGTAFVLSLCAEADAFVAAGFTAFPLPAQLAFLVFGPMFDIKLLLMYRQVFTPRFIAILFASLVTLIELYALLLGFLP